VKITIPRELVVVSVNGTVASTSNATVFLLRSEMNLVNNLCVIWAYAAYVSVVNLNTLGINYVSVSVQLYGPAVLIVRGCCVYRKAGLVNFETVRIWQ